jgi:ketosteroid isomerase-like protein
MNVRARQLNITVMAAVVGLTCGGPAKAADMGEAAVLTATAGFYSALNRLFVGDGEPMKAVWSHSDDISYMGPTGQYDRGWNEVLKDWQAQAAMKLGGKVGPSDMRVVVGQELAVVTCYEVGENTNAGGKVAQVKLRATNVFRNEGGVWKMIGHQTDKLPYLAK